MNTPDFVIVGSGGGGGTISWLLARAGFSVVLLEQGTDFGKQAEAHLGGGPEPRFNAALHDEYRFRVEKPDPKRRLRGSYNTFRTADGQTARPLRGMGGFTASILGGGSVLWGTWAFRALPVDFKLKTFFAGVKQLELFERWGYSVADWPVRFNEMEPYYNLAEALFAVCGDREATNEAVTGTDWYREFKDKKFFAEAGNWEPEFPYQGPAYPLVPVGHFFYDGMERAGLNPLMLANALVSPGEKPYDTRAAIAKALVAWDPKTRPAFWSRKAEQLWSERRRDPCNMCGYCGEFLCWGQSGPKSSTRFTTLRELADSRNAEIRTDSVAYEVTYNPRTRRATGVRYLDVSDPDCPRQQFLPAKNVIVSCGAVQTARLLLMSGPPGGLGNRYDQLGRNVMFHLFGFGAKAVLPPKFQGKLHAEYGHTGNITGYDYYLVQDDRPDAPADVQGRWCKAGTLASAAKKNPLENAEILLQNAKVPREDRFGVKLLKSIELYTRNVELRLTGDDLPMPRNRVDLDPTHVDEYGLPVARITRDFGPNERWMFDVMKQRLQAVFDPYIEAGVLKKEDVRHSGGLVDLIGDHQLGTCRMGEDPTTSVIDPFCRMHEVPNVFVVDSSFMPTGLGLNPLMTVVANALRVGTWIVEQSKGGGV